MNGGDRAIEIGAVIVENGRIVDKYQSLINPGRHVPDDITDLTGISIDMVRKARPPEIVFAEVRKFVSGSMLVAHNASFDRKFWNFELNRLGYPNDEQFICTLLISRRLYPWSKNHQLRTLATSHALPVDGSLHRALSDSTITAYLLLKMIRDLAGLYPDRVVDSSFLIRYQKARKVDARSLPKRRAHSKAPRSDVVDSNAKSRLDSNQTTYSSEPRWNTPHVKMEPVALPPKTQKTVLNTKNTNRITISNERLWITPHVKMEPAALPPKTQKTVLNTENTSTDSDGSWGWIWWVIVILVLIIVFD